MATATLTTTAERLGEHRVKLRVEVPDGALRPAVDAAYRRWAGEMRVPGFRKGKVPRQIIDARVGREAIRQEALQDALPDLYEEALQAENLEAIAPPEIDVVAFEDGSPLIFEATVDVRPEVVVPDLSAISIDAPPSEVTEQDIDEHLERLRDRFAEVETVHREVKRGDFALIDLKGSLHGEPVEGASQPDLLYEVGSRSGPPQLDEQLEGNRPGAILRFTDVPGGEPAGQEISFTVLLKEVKAKKLPALDDEFAKTVGEFDTLAELRAELKEGLANVKRSMAEQELRNLAMAALVRASTFDSPDKLVEQEFKHRLEHFEADLRNAGLTLEEYGRQTQNTELEIRRDIRAEAVKAVKAELLLEQVARDNDIEVTREDIGRELGLLAARLGRSPNDIAQDLSDSRRAAAMAADIMRRKSLDFVVEQMDVSGRPAAEAVGDSVAGESL